MIVFAGPSIVGLDCDATAGLEVRAPVQQGDVFLAAQKRPEVIGIIDGYFEGAPAVWHKEILWAMSQGIAVLGAASMGALRAAELDAFGMVGVGKIYQDFASGELEDDDEVALLHGPSELGYQALSLAMVNVRAVLESATRAEVISDAQRAHLSEVAKTQFYKTRNWQAIAAGAEQKVITATELEGLLSWIDRNPFDQKQDDAALLLGHIREGKFEKPQCDFHFEETALWVNAQEIWRARQGEAPDTRHQKFADRELLGG